MRSERRSFGRLSTVCSRAQRPPTPLPRGERGVLSQGNQHNILTSPPLPPPLELACERNFCLDWESASEPRPPPRFARE